LRLLECESSPFKAVSFVYIRMIVQRMHVLCSILLEFLRLWKEIQSEYVPLVPEEKREKELAALVPHPSYFRSFRGFSEQVKFLRLRFRSGSSRRPSRQ